jgi:hypothetical protein
MQDRQSWVIVAGVALALVVGVVSILFLGGRTQSVLSTVGAAIPEMPAGATTDTTGGADSATTAPDSTAGPVAAANAVAPAQLLVVRTGTLTLEAATIAPIVSDAAGLVTDAGGFVAGSKESGSDVNASAVVDYRIPAAAWEPTLARLRALGTVRAQEINSDEVSGQVVDLGARIANLRATEAALQAIMAKATRIDDVLAVQKQLTDTRGQIEELTAQKAGLEDHAAFGSLTVTFALPPRPAPAATRPPGWDPARDVDAASGKLVQIGETATTAGIWFSIVGLPVLAALAVAAAMGWIAWKVVGRLRRRLDPGTAGG